MIQCGEIDPEWCHIPDSTCCGNELVCSEDYECCGTDACCIVDPTDDDSFSKCCPGEESESLCCEKYDTCCDGWCMCLPLKNDWERSSDQLTAYT